jgi:hypothetical protein
VRRIGLIGILAGVTLSVLAFGSVGVSLALENQDVFCASCHTEPEATYYLHFTQPNPVTLAALHTQKKTDCIDCHSGSGILGRSKGLTQGAQDLMAFLSGTYRHPAVALNPLGDDSCLKCHQDVSQRRPGGSRATNGHYHLFLPRWQAADPQAAYCVTCHTAHTYGLDGLQFMTQGRLAQVCDDCHNALGGH